MSAWSRTPSRRVASGSSGNILSFDGSMEGFEETMKQMTLLGRARTPNDVKTH